VMKRTFLERQNNDKTLRFLCGLFYECLIVLKDDRLVINLNETVEA
jgi:hypothetical protein